jgi:hypothetical protein
MSDRNKSKVWLSLVAACAFALLAVAAIPALTPPVRADLPPRQPTSTPTPNPTSTTSPKSPSRSAATQIVLSAQFPAAWPWAKSHWQTVKTVVQWQNAEGKWYDVEGWRGELDSVAVDASGVVTGKKVWWVANANLNQGPFRWMVYLGDGGKPLAQSEPFDLPGKAGGVTLVEVSLSTP